MKRFVNVSVIALILAGLCACASQSSLQTDAIKLGNSRELFSLSDFVEPIKFISLESSDSCMIRFVRKVIQTGDGYIILGDMPGGSIAAFSDDGKFRHYFGRIGQGPGEYTFVDDIALSPSRDSLLVCVPNACVYTYSLDGVFGRKITADEYIPLTRIATNSENIAMCATSIAKGFNRFYLYSPQMKLKFEGIPNGNGFHFGKDIYMNDKAAYFFDWYENVLYEISTSENVVSRTWELSMPNNVASHNINDFMSFNDKFLEVGYVEDWGISQGNFIAEYLVDGIPYIFIYDLENNSAKKHGKYLGQILELFPANNDGYFISVITYDAYEFFKDNLLAGAGLPPFDEEKTDVILMLWRVKI